MQIDGTFNARTVQPQQGTPMHPNGMFDAQITHTEIKPTGVDAMNPEGTGGRLVIEFTTPAGRIQNGYNLWNNSAQAVEIANKQLSALCHATGVYDLDYKNEAAAFRGARCRIEVAPQKKNPEFVEVARVFDSAGNEPGRPGATQAPQQGAWGGQQQQPNPAPQSQPQGQQPLQQQPNGGGWQQPQSQPASPPPPPAAPSWQQNQPAPGGAAPNAAPSSPPWGQRG